jgi:hypothetical protein
MPPGWESQLLQRAPRIAVVLALFIGGYFVIGHAVLVAPVHDVAIPLDARIPFLPWTVFVYASVYTSAFLPAFVVRDEALFRRTFRAYVFVLLASFVVFVLFPVSSAGLRADLSEVGGFAGWGLHVIYALDPPRNLLPSLHLAIASVALVSLWMARPIYGRLSALWLLPVAASVCTTKQHFVLDAVAGILLGAVAWAIFLRSHESEAGAVPYYPWKGPQLYVAFLGLFYAAAWGAYRAGFAP